LETDAYRKADRDRTSIYKLLAACEVLDRRPTRSWPL